MLRIYIAEETGLLAIGTGEDMIELTQEDVLVLRKFLAGLIITDVASEVEF